MIHFSPFWRWIKIKHTTPAAAEKNFLKEWGEAKCVSEKQLFCFKNPPSNFVIASLCREAFISPAVLGAHVRAHALSKPLLQRQNWIKLQVSCEPYKIFHSSPIWVKYHRVTSCLILYSKALICPRSPATCILQQGRAFLFHVFVYLHVLACLEKGLHGCNNRLPP